jgi:hypothetical protein
VVCSFSDKPLSWKFPRSLSRKGAAGKRAKLLLANYPRAGTRDGKKDSAWKEIRKRHFVRVSEICRPLRPYEAQVWKIAE